MSNNFEFDVEIYHDEAPEEFNLKDHSYELILKIRSQIKFDLRFNNPDSTTWSKILAGEKEIRIDNLDKGIFHLKLNKKTNDLFLYYYVFRGGEASRGSPSWIDTDVVLPYGTEIATAILNKIIEVETKYGE
jgi:hypothetical protein